MKTPRNPKERMPVPTDSWNQEILPPLPLPVPLAKIRNPDRRVGHRVLIGNESTLFPPGTTQDVPREWLDTPHLARLLTSGALELVE